jgi:adenylylsulfate kinase
MSTPTAFTVWLTGLPASGKRTVANGLETVVARKGLAVELIDSGKLRQTPLGAHLGFSRGERDQNVRRHAFAAQLLVRNGVVAIVSAVSPYRSTREAIREELGSFVEVYVSTPRATCVERDPKGDWARALRGEIRNFTGVDDPYEAPENPEIEIDMSKLDVSQAVDEIVSTLCALGHLPDDTQEVTSEDQELLSQKLRDLGYVE